jgi:hypothetical protein
LSNIQSSNQVGAIDLSAGLDVADANAIEVSFNLWLNNKSLF